MNGIPQVKCSKCGKTTPATIHLHICKHCGKDPRKSK